jgi:surface polysaccharide O-acyltransferase-like enzyme
VELPGELLAFDAAAAGLYLLWPRWGSALGRATEGAQRRPVVFFTLLAAASAVAYIPLALAFNPFRWTEFGPFFFQTSRILHYAVYFLAGLALGASGLDKGLLAPDGKLARRWPLWLSASFVAFSVMIAIMIIISAPGKVVSRSLEITGDTVFSLSCAASSLAFLALFLRFTRRSGPVFASLRRNAFGMYLVHYAFASWLPYALLPAQMSGMAKGTVAFLGTVALSWGTTALLRRLPGVARVV